MSLITGRLLETDDVGRTMVACSKAGIGLDIFLAAYLLSGVRDEKLEGRLHERFFLPDYLDRDAAVAAIRSRGTHALTGTLLDVVNLYYNETLPRFHDRMHVIEDEEKQLALECSDQIRVAPLTSIMNFVQRGECYA